MPEWLKPAKGDKMEEIHAMIKEMYAKICEKEDEEEDD